MTRTNYRHACGKSKKEDADVPKRIFLLLLIVLVTITGANAQEGNPKEEIRPETKKPLDANLGEQLKPGESVLDANLGDENDQKNSYPPNAPAQNPGYQKETISAETEASVASQKQPDPEPTAVDEDKPETKPQPKTEPKKPRGRGNTYSDGKTEAWVKRYRNTDEVDQDLKKVEVTKNKYGYYKFSIPDEFKPQWGELAKFTIVKDGVLQIREDRRSEFNTLLLEDAFTHIKANRQRIDENHRQIVATREEMRFRTGYNELNLLLVEAGYASISRKEYEGFRNSMEESRRDGSQEPPFDQLSNEEKLSKYVMAANAEPKIQPRPATTPQPTPAKPNLSEDQVHTGNLDLVKAVNGMGNKMILFGLLGLMVLGGFGFAGLKSLSKQLGEKDQRDEERFATSDHLKSITKETTTKTGSSTGKIDPADPPAQKGQVPTEKPTMSGEKARADKAKKDLPMINKQNPSPPPQTEPELPPMHEG